MVDFKDRFVRQRVGFRMLRDLIEVIQLQLQVVANLIAQATRNPVLIENVVFDVTAKANKDLVEEIEV